MKNISRKSKITIPLFILSCVFILSCNFSNNDEDSLSKTQINQNEPRSTELSSKVEKTSNVFWIKGTGSVKQKQEIIEVNIAIEHRDKEIINATNVVNENIKKTIAIAKTLDIDENKIVTKEYSISPVTRWVEKKDEYGEYGESQIIAYKVYNSVVITSEDKDKITKFIDEANSETGNSFRVNSVTFKAKLNEENKMLAREKAVEDAMNKAKFYEKELDINLGKIISFEEFQPGTVNKSQNDMMPRMMMAEAMPSTELFSGESEVISEIYLGFEIK